VFFINNNFNYAIFPLELITNEKYKKLTSNEKLLYTLLLNRKNLSQKNSKLFCDNNGVFVYYSNEQIQKHLNCSQPTITLALNNLQQAGLIRKEYQENGLPLKIYVNDIRSGDRNIQSSVSQKPQDKFSQKPYSNSFNKEKTHTNHSPKEEKQVSFDVDLEREMEYKNLMTFAQKTKKRRTRNTGPTI
jgi:DNA-binding MarR family transcriptional regulator